MTSTLASNHGSKERSSTRTRRRGLASHASFIIGALALAATACSSDSKKPTSDDDGGTKTATDSQFESCMAQVQPLCKTHDEDTAEKLEMPCKAIEFIPIPLTDGTQYGPKTIEAGPYASKIDWNQGAGTEFVNPVNSMEPVCLPTGIDTFMEPAATTDDLKNTRGLDYSLYTIFRPACMKDGETYPVITWANGTCGLTHGYAVLLGTIASYGYVIVASNSTWTNTAPTDKVQERAIDYAESLNDDTTSVLYHKLDLDKIGAMGHSQGAAATINAAKDERVKSVIFWNLGATNDKPFLTVSADHDVGMSTVASLTALADGATQPGEWIFFHQILMTGGNTTGHLVLMEQPDRVWQMAVDYWNWQLRGDQKAKKTFVGSDCTLCNSPDQYDYGVNSNVQ